MNNLWPNDFNFVLDDIEDGSLCTCGINTGHYKRSPDCPIHAEDVNRKVIVDIEVPASYGTLERVYPYEEVDKRLI